MRRMLQGRAGMGLAFILGLVIATAGTATAAKLITGKQIKDGSISAKDLSKALQKQLAKTGAPGAAGARGLPGPAGSQGKDGKDATRTHTTKTTKLPYAGILLYQTAHDLDGFGELQVTCGKYKSIFSYWELASDGSVRLKNTTNDTLIAGRGEAAIAPGGTGRVLLPQGALVEENGASYVPSKAQMLIEDGRVYNASTNRLLSFSVIGKLTADGCEVKTLITGVSEPVAG